MTRIGSRAAGWLPVHGMQFATSSVDDSLSIAADVTSKVGALD